MGTTMPQIYLSIYLYDAIVKLGENPSEFVSNAVEKELEKRKKGGAK